MVGKQVWAREGLLRPGRSHAFYASSAVQLRGLVAPKVQNKLLAAALCKGKVSSGSQQQPQRASAQESNASRFRPLPSALQRAKRGGAAPGSLGPADLLGITDAQNLLPKGSPWRGSRIGRAKAFCAQAAAMPPEPARPLSAEAPSQRRPKTSFSVLHSAKGNSSSSKPHPLLALAHESSVCCFRSRPCALHRAKGGRAAPGSLGPDALLGLSGA